MPFGAIGKLGWDDQLPFAAYLHRPQPFNPSLDDGVRGQSSSVGLASIVRAVEFCSVRERPDIIHCHILTRLRTRSRPFHQINISETGSGLDLNAAAAKQKEGDTQNGEPNDDANGNYLSGRGRAFLGGRIGAPRVAPALTGLSLTALWQFSVHLADDI